LGREEVNTEELTTWLQQNGFTEMHAGTWEAIWSPNDGYGYITFRVMRHDRGWWVIAETGNTNERIGINLGTCKTLAEIKAVFDALYALRWKDKNSPMRTTTVTCDRCGKDLSTTTNCEDYRILLCAEPIPPSSDGALTAMHIEPPFSRPIHFCGRRCLDEWLNA
jgi:hypothetical protein